MLVVPARRVYRDDEHLIIFKPKIPAEQILYDLLGGLEKLKIIKCS